MPRSPVYASLIVTGRNIPEFERLAELIEVDGLSEKKWGHHIGNCYQCAYAFFFNEFFRKSLAVSYLGSECVEYPGALKKVWIDYIHIWHKQLLTGTIHANMAFPGLSVDVERADDENVGIIADFLGGVYQFTERETSPLATLDRLRSECGFGSIRRFALDMSRYVYVSLPGLKSEQIDKPSDALLTNIYRLLYLHRDGVDIETAKMFLKDATWSTAMFYKAYYQPGGMVTMASLFPEQTQKDNPDWFFPVFEGEKHLGPLGYDRYDLLPEYPPLRYLAMPALDFAGMYEETLREIFNRLLNDFHLLTESFHDELSVLAARYYLAQNMEAVRLPIARPLVSRLIESKMQTSTSEAISGMSQRVVSRRNTIVAVGALLVAVASLVVSIVAILKG